MINFEILIKLLGKEYKMEDIREIKLLLASKS